jgi:hypothetical protein
VNLQRTRIISGLDLYVLLGVLGSIDRNSKKLIDVAIQPRNSAVHIFAALFHFVTLNLVDWSLIFSFVWRSVSSSYIEARARLRAPML